MLPFLEIPICLPGNEGEKEKEVIARIQPEQIQCYYEGYNFGTFIYLNGGVVLLSPRNVIEIQRGIANYWMQIKKMENKPNFLLG